MIYVGLDDFCDEHAEEFEQVLLKILPVYPNFRATLYTIPKKTSPEVLGRWTRTYPMLQFALHGLTHADGETWFHEYDLCKQIIQENFGRAVNGYCGNNLDYVAGFKAPWWKLGHVAARAFNDMGYWVATNGTHTVDDAMLPMCFNHKRGNDEVIKDIFYRNIKLGQSFWHGHVQSQRKYNNVDPNGIGDVLDVFLNKFLPTDRQFGFANDFFNCCEQCFGRLPCNCDRLTEDAAR